MPTSKQSRAPVTKSAICPNSGIAQVMYDARLVDSFKEEDRKFDLIPTITIFTSSLSQLFGMTLQPFVAPNLLTTWTNAPQIEIWPIFGDRGDKIPEKIWSGDTCGPEPLDHLIKRSTKVCNCSNILVVEYLHMRQWLKKITRNDILIVFYSKCFQYFNWID